MGTVNCVVDTQPMANSVDSVSHHLNLTAAAVVAMQEAVIKSEKEAADTICRNVDRGFLSLMQSQINTKKAQYYSSLNSSMMMLMELAKSLDAKSERMESDVARLHRQYYKIFHSIDSALENRVFQLNKDAMTLASQRKDLITSRTLKDMAAILCTDQEATETEKKTLIARMKNKTKRALTNIGNEVEENEEYKYQVESLLENRQLSNADTECIPVLVVKEDSMVMQDSSVLRVVIPEEMNESCRSDVENTIMQRMDEIVSVPKNQYEQNEVTREFMQLANSSNLNPRVAGVMMKLFEMGGR